MSVEKASLVEDRSAVETVIARAPDHIRAAINRARIARGLTPVLSVRDYQRLDQERRIVDAIQSEQIRGPGVWVNGPRGSLVPASSIGKSWSGSKTVRTQARGRRITRVLMVAAYGDASAWAVRGSIPETIAFNAFGSAAELNCEKGWTLRSGHGGPLLATAGERLRAHDSTAGLVVEWIPDMALAWNRAAVQAIEDGKTACSVGMKIAETRLARLPHPVSMITRARLEHVALLDDDYRPAYPGARAKVFRDVFENDRDELRKQIEATIERARWFARQSRGY